MLGEGLTKCGQSFCHCVHALMRNVGDQVASVNMPCSIYTTCKCTHVSLPNCQLASVVLAKAAFVKDCWVTYRVLQQPALFGRVACSGVTCCAVLAMLVSNLHVLALDCL